MTKFLARRTRCSFLAALLLLAPGGALSGKAAAQSAPPMQGHPPVGGHPPVPGHPGGGGNPLQNLSSPDPSLDSGSVLVEVRDEERRPLGNISVKLEEQFQSVAKGNEVESKKALTDAEGRAVFSNLKNTLRYSYTVVVERDGAKYDIAPFRLEKTGHRVVVHTYPATSDINGSLIGVRGFAYFSLRADVLSVEMMFRVMNMGQKTWLPKGIEIELPKGAEAIEARASVGDSRFEKRDGAVELQGSFPPGQKDLSFTFQLPNTNVPTRLIEFGVPPHLAEIRVLAEEIPGMSLRVSPGFEPVDSAPGPEEKPVFITRRVMRPGEPELSRVEVELDGLPVIGPGRYYALALALVILLLGLGAAFAGQSQSERLLKRERKAAREALLAEMLALKQAAEKQAIGPRTFENTRREILLALARLEPQNAAPEKRSA